jgi:hypothetical protein
VVKGAVRGATWGRPERRLACVNGDRVFGLGRWVDGGMETRREVAEQRWRKIGSSVMSSSNILQGRVVNTTVWVEWSTA